MQLVRITKQDKCYINRCNIIKNKKGEKSNIKKHFWGILIAVVILSIGLPRITGNGLSSLSLPEEKKEVEQLEEKLRQGSFRPLDKLMVQSYEAKPNGHQWEPSSQKSFKNYRITYYTFFEIRYTNGEVSKAGGMIGLPDLPLS